MKHQIISILIALAFVACWGVNLVKLVKLDFEPSYKAEIVRSIGVVLAPSALIINWIEFEEEKD